MPLLRSRSRRQLPSTAIWVAFCNRIACRVGFCLNTHRIYAQMLFICFLGQKKKRKPKNAVFHVPNEPQLSRRHSNNCCLTVGEEGRFQICCFLPALNTCKLEHLSKSSPEKRPFSTLVGKQTHRGSFDSIGPLSLIQKTFGISESRQSRKCVKQLNSLLNRSKPH